MKDPLSKFKISATGDFGPARKHENIKRWVESNGGKWATSITKDTTHLICSKEHWKRQVKAVKEAQEHQHIKIVSYDWLEDSLQHKTRKREGSYLLSRIEKGFKVQRLTGKTKERKVAKREVFKFKQGCNIARTDLQSGTFSKPKKRPLIITPKASRKSTSWATSALLEESKRRKVSDNIGPVVQFNRIMPQEAPANAIYKKLSEERADTFLRKPGCPLSPHGHPICGLSADTILNLNGPDNHHIYQDSTGFDYLVVLTRIDLGNNRNERYLICLFESHTRPHVYSTTIRYSAPGRDSVSQVLMPLGSSFEDAFKAFQMAFRGKTRKHWDERLEPPDDQIRGNGEPVTYDPRIKPFAYVPPEEDKPRGLLPGTVLRMPFSGVDDQHLI